MSALPAPIAGPARVEEARRLTPEAFSDAFARSGRALWCIAAGVLGRSDEAEDVLQEGAMIALRKLDQFDPETNFIAWMGRIVRYVALNHARRRKRRAITTEPAALESISESSARDDSSPATTGRGDLLPDQSCFDDRVLAALDTLEETARSCLLLRTLLDMPYREISLALDVPEGTAMSHVHRAQRAMRDRLRGDDPTTVRRTTPRARTEDRNR